MEENRPRWEYEKSRMSNTWVQVLISRKWGSIEDSRVGGKWLLLFHPNTLIYIYIYIWQQEVVYLTLSIHFSLSFPFSKKQYENC